MDICGITRPTMRTRREVYDYLFKLNARFRFFNGKSDLEVVVQPDVMGNGVFLYRIDHNNYQEWYVRLTTEIARQVGAALVSMVDTRVRFGNGGGSDLEIAVQRMGGGIFLAMIDHGGQEFSVEGKIRKTRYQERGVRLTPEIAGQLGSALAFLAGESEIDSCRGNE